MNETKNAIHKAFLQQYISNPYEKMTVKDLCITTPVARTTFYSYYDNINDVKNEIEDNLIQGLLSVTQNVSHGNLPEMDFLEFLDATQMYVENHWEIFEAFIVKQPNYRFINKWKSAIKNNFRKRYPQKQAMKNYELVSEVIASATMGAYEYWLQYPNRVKKEDVKKLITKALDTITEIL